MVQPQVQRELEQREWAERDDNVMAEYVTVLLGKLPIYARIAGDELTGAANGNTRGKLPSTRSRQRIKLTLGRTGPYRDGRL